MMLIDEKHTIGDIVYLKVDPDQTPLLVVGINVRPGHLTYVMTSGNNETVVAYDLELSTTKTIMV